MQSKAKQLGTWRISNYTPEYRETSGVGRRKLLTMDEVLRLPVSQALVIIRGHKVLKVDKLDYTYHPEASKLRPCKASAHIPDWVLLSQNKKPQSPVTRHKAPKKRSVIPTDKNSIITKYEKKEEIEVNAKKEN